MIRLPLIAIPAEHVIKVLVTCSSQFAGACRKYFFEKLAEGATPLRGMMIQCKARQVVDELEQASHAFSKTLYEAQQSAAGAAGDTAESAESNNDSADS